MRACVRACVRVCVGVCVWVGAFFLFLEYIIQQSFTFLSHFVLFHKCPLCEVPRFGKVWSLAELANIFSYKTRVGQNLALHASPTARKVPFFYSNSWIYGRAGASVYVTQPKTKRESRTTN